MIAARATRVLESDQVLAPGMVALAWVIALIAALNCTDAALHHDALTGHRMLPAFGTISLFLLATWSGEGVGPAGFLEPLELAVDAAGNVYVASYRLVQKLSSDGDLLASWETAGPHEPGLALPAGIAVGGDGSVYVVERYNNLVRKFAQRGQPL